MNQIPNVFELLNSGEGLHIKGLIYLVFYIVHDAQSQKNIFFAAIPTNQPIKHNIYNKYIYVWPYNT